MGEVANIYAKVGVSMDGFRRGMNEMDSTIHKSGGAFRNFTTGIIQGMGQAFGQAAMRGIREFGDVMADTLKNAAGLEQGVADIAAVMGTTASESAELSKLITDLGVDPKLKVTAFEAAGAIEMLAKNGLNLEQIMGGAARSTVLLSNSTGGDFATSADVATSAMAQFKIKAEDMTGAVNQIVGVTKNSKFDINDYRLAISQAGGVAASVGVSFQDFNATIAAISPLFASGSDAGTSFKTFLQRLAPDTAPAKDAMRELGILTEDGQNKFFTASGAMKSMSEIAQILKESFGGLSEEQKILYSTNIFGTDAMRTAFALADGGAGIIDKLTGAISKANAEQSAATRMDTLSGDWEIFQGVLETLSIQIGQKFLPAARGIVQWATQLATEKGPQLVEFFGKIADMLPGLGRTALGFFDNISGPGVTKTVSMLANAFLTLGKVLATLVRPFKEAFGGLFQELSAMRSSGFSDIFAVILRRIGQAITGFGKLIASEALPFIMKTLGDLWNAISGWVAGVSWDDIKGWAKAFWNWAVDLWTALSPYLVAFWNELSSWVTDPAKRQQLWDGIVNGWNVFSQWAVSVWEWMKPGLIAGWNWLSSWITDPAKRQQLWDGIVTVWNVFTEWSLAIWNWMAPGLLATWNYLSSWVTDPAKRQQLWDGVVAVWNVFGEWAAAIWNWMSPHLAAAWNYLSSWVTDPAKRQQLWDGVVAGWNVFTEWALSIWNWVSPHLLAAWQSISSWVTDPIKRQIMVDTMNGWGRSLTEWAGWLWSGGEGFEGVGPKLGRFWGEMTSWITDPIKRQSIIDTVKGWGTTFVDWATGIWEGADGKGGLKSVLTRWWGNFMGWMEENFPKTHESLLKLSDTFQGFFDTLRELFTYEDTDGVRKSWVFFWEGMNGTSKEKIDTILADITNLVDRITRLFSGLAKIAIGFKNNEWGPIWDGIAELSGVAIEQATIDITDFAKFVPDTLDMKLMGDMRKTQTTWSDIWAAIGLQPGKAKDKIKTDLDAHSPSKEFQKIAQSVISAFDGFGPQWSSIWTGLSGAVGAGLSGAQGALGGPLQSIVNAFNTVMDSFKKHVFSVMVGIGQDIGNGMVQGIRDKINSVVEVLNYLAQLAPEWVRKALGINSPSKVFIEIGKQVTAGFAKGIEDNMNMPQLSMESMVRHTVEAVPGGTVPASMAGQDGGGKRLDVYLHAGDGVLPSNRQQLQQLMQMMQRELTSSGMRVAY